MYEDLKSAGVAIAGEPASGGNVGIAYWTWPLSGSYTIPSFTGWLRCTMIEKPFQVLSTSASEQFKLALQCAIKFMGYLTEYYLAGGLWSISGYMIVDI